MVRRVAFDFLSDCLNCGCHARVFYLQLRLSGCTAEVTLSQLHGPDSFAEGHLNFDLTSPRAQDDRESRYTSVQYVPERNHHKKIGQTRLPPEHD